MTDHPPFIERDISWLHFNARVLQEAKDPQVPLYERIKFLAIYSSNLDEFFRVRVASLRSYRKLKKKTRKKMPVRPKTILKEIRELVHAQQTEFGHIFREELIPQLKEHQINLIDNRSFNEAQKTFALQYYKEQLAADIKWMPIKKEDIPFLEDKSLYLIAQCEKEDELACVNFPKKNRFIVLPKVGNQHCITFIDDIIRIGIKEQFKEHRIIDTFSVKMSRDAEMYIDDEFEGDLLDKIKKGLKEREIGLPARFLYDSSMPEEVLKKIKTLFDLSKNDLIPGARYHNFNDFFGFPDPSENPTLHNPPQPPLPHPVLSKKPEIIPAIAKKDYIVHYPYQQFDHTAQLIEEAALDPQVDFLKVTLYRVAAKSSVGEALLKALSNGKKVTAFIEAKARFDEESNLFWGNQLSEAGAKVRYSFPGIKVHTKLLLIGRREGEKIRHYAYIATGNFNEKTAKLYSDFGLMTADKKIGEEISQVFKMLEGEVLLPKTKNVLVAPHTLRKGFYNLIDKEIQRAKKGQEAWMILKMNSLEDKEMMYKLIEASQAGVQIQMIVRGICRLVPGIPGLTENIRITSIIDRYLEHARVYIFGAGGKTKIYLASADWMTRNLSRRVEVAFPIIDPSIKKTIMDVIQLQLNDNVKTRIIDATGKNEYVRNEKNKVRAQIDTYQYFKQQ